MGVESFLKYVTKGVDSPNASQHNIMVRLLKAHEKRHHYVRNRDDVRITKTENLEEVEAFSTYVVSDIESDVKNSLSYSVEEFEAENTDVFDVVIASGVTGWGNFGNFPVQARIGGTPPGIGGNVGPRTGETTLIGNAPGFRYLGASNLAGVGWVIRDRGVALGQGTMVVTSGGEGGTPGTFDLEGVGFSSGFDGWDHDTELEVVNVFSDEASDGLIVQFKWDANSQQYVSTDVECA